jgi:hypothetical protein
MKQESDLGSAEALLSLSESSYPGWLTLPSDLCRSTGFLLNFSSLDKTGDSTRFGLPKPCCYSESKERRKERQREGERKKEQEEEGTK